MSAGSILVVDDDAEMCALLVAALGKRGFAVTTRTSGDAALALLDDADFDVVVTDLNMPGTTGLDLCARVTSNRPDMPVVVITAFGSLETAVAAIRAGAYDFVTKPFEIETARAHPERAVAHRRLRAEVRRLRQAAAADALDQDEIGLPGTMLIGRSPAMRRMYDTSMRAAATDASVLVTGESGTGKELVARALHDKRAARGRPVRRDQLRGGARDTARERAVRPRARRVHRRARQPPGLFVQANGGTLFLDEIGEMPLGLQPKLLRALQERTVRPVGGDAERAVRRAPRRARPTAISRATVETGRFREDLYYRINVIHIDLPPLRARGGDVLLLAQHFVAPVRRQRRQERHRHRRPAAEKLLAYDWPGNVRELQNCIERAVALTRFDEITVDDLPEQVRDYRRSRLVLALDDPANVAATGRGRAPLHPARARGGRRQQAPAPRRCSASIARRSTASSSATASATRSEAGILPPRGISPPPSPRHATPS